MIPAYIAVIVIAVCVISQALFSGSEIAIVSADKIKLRHLAKRGDRSSRLIMHMLEKPQWFLSTTLLGTNISTIIYTTVAAAQFYDQLGEIGIPISIVLMSSVSWVFGEIVPKSIFQQISDGVIHKVIYILRAFSIIFYPLVLIFSTISNLISNVIIGRRGHKIAPFISREELRLLMKMKGGKSDIEPAERQMIDRVLSFTETKAVDMMVPLIEVEMINENSTVKDAIEKFVDTKHRRLPVYSERVDKIVGLLNSFDILGESRDKVIKPFVRPAFYIPPNINANELLEKLQSTGNNMAIIVDEYGGAEGIITIEDILEEVVGEIEDEYDYDSIPPRYKTLENGSIIATGRVEVDELNELFDLDIPKGDYETIGGFVINKLNKIPVAGETIRIPKAVITVQKSTSRNVLEVRVDRVSGD